MIEADWRTSTKPDELLQAARGRVSHRKLRLVACACCRRHWDYLDSTDRLRIELTEAAVEGAEPDRRLIDGYTTRVTSAFLGGPVPLSDATATLGWPDEAPESWSFVQVGRELIPRHQVPGLWAEDAIRWILDRLQMSVAGSTSLLSSFEPSALLGRWQRQVDERTAQAELIRCIISGPSPPAAFSPDWRTDTAVALARRMYDARDFSLLPILADALEDAGCDAADLLAHCRTPGPHARGCRVVDLVLGLE